jgi:cytochrome c biogenesis protein CcmG, thiol:disulfide interchange protein DsbE
MIRIKSFIRLLGALLLLPAVHACTPARTPAGVGRDAPDGSLLLADGGELRLSSTRGDVVVLAFFTTWCRTSPATLRALETLQWRNSALGLATTVIAIDEGDSVGEVKEFRGRLGLRLTVGYDTNNHIAEEMGLVTLPSLVIIDHRGIVRHVHAGYHGNEEGEVIAREVASLLGESTSD